MQKANLMVGLYDTRPNVSYILDQFYHNFNTLFGLFLEVLWDMPWSGLDVGGVGGRNPPTPPILPLRHGDSQRPFFDPLKTDPIALLIDDLGILASLTTAFDRFLHLVQGRLHGDCDAAVFQHQGDV